MDAGQADAETIANGCKTDQTAAFRPVDSAVEIGVEDTGESHGMGTQPGTGRFLWDSIGSATAITWMFLCIAVYMLRFLVSLWDAGARGIYGL